MEENVLNLYKEIISDLKKSSKRSFIIIIILLVMLFASNMAWLVYESQFETVAETTTVDAGDGIATYLENSESGDIIYGEDN